MRRALFLLAISACCASGAEQWTRLNSPHFELYTTASEKRGRELILYFEQVRSFFAQISPNRNATEFPVRIVVFRSEKQYKPYAPNEVAAAFFAPGRYRDYIVLGDTEPDHLPAAIHEYAHLFVHHSGLKLPVWLNEGWADLFSSLKPLAGKALVGELLPGRVRVLQSEKWMSFDELTSVGPKSATYNEKNRAGIFYAQSWAFVHMLYLAPEYAPKFGAFVSAINRGKTAAEACRLAYGRASSQVDADLQAYLRRNRLFGVIFDVKLTKSEEDAQSSQASPFESDAMLADLLSIVGRKDQAFVAFRKLAAENPDKPEIPQSLGYMLWQDNDRDGARKEFEKAFASGDKDPQMCYHLAMLEFEKDRTSGQAMAALRRAVEVKPDYTDARLQLGLAEMNTGNYGGGLTSLQQIHRIDDEHAATLFNALAYGYLQTGDREHARTEAQTALKWSKSDTDKQRSESLLAVIDTRAQVVDAPDRPHLSRSSETPTETQEPPAPPKNPFVKPGEKIERAEGMAKSMDCEGKRFVIESEGKPIAFDMPDPLKVQLRHNGGDTFEFTCGPQKPFHVIVEYVSSEKLRPGVIGSLRSLEF